MNHILLYRDIANYDGDNPCVMGEMRVNDKHTLYTIERPWIPDAPGGRPFESCVPHGRYRCIEHRRGNGDKVIALVNYGLGVYYRESDRKQDCGRYKILIHAANYVAEVAGCIAPGLNRDPSVPMVTSSRKAMKKLWEALSPSHSTILDIVWADEDLQGVPYA